MMTNHAARPDSDSLMALQALLKFRSDSIAESEESTMAESHRNYKNTAPRVDNDASAQNEKPCRKRPPPQRKQEVRYGQALSHVTPPFGATSPRSALSPSFTLNYELLPNNSHLAAAPYSPVVPSMGPVEPVSVPSLTVSLPFGGVNDTMDTTGMTDASFADKPVVRTNEIVAAFKSKPQRGRKRENLSEQERLELTRTRNREHAKSTRIRKKARHQELLDSEQKYHELKKVQDLCKQRSECFCRFLSIRESMLRWCLDKKQDSQEENQQPCAPNNADPSQETTSERGLVSPQRAVKFVQFQMANESFLSNNDADTPPKSLCNVVDADTGFEFKTCGGTLDFLSEAALDTADSTAAMKLFDKSLATRVEQMMDKSSVKKLSYKVANGGIAINETGTGFAQVSIAIRDCQREVTIMTALVKFQFGRSDNNKLKSVVWHNIEERFDHAYSEDSDCRSSASGESLGCQTSFPSVVSLDQGGGDAADTKPPAEDGPGMNII